MGCDAEYGMSKMSREIDQLTTRNAELEAEVARLEDELRSSQHAERFAHRLATQYSNVSDDLLSDVKRLNTSLGNAHKECEEKFDEITRLQLDLEIARNALKETGL